MFFLAGSRADNRVSAARVSESSAQKRAILDLSDNYTVADLDAFFTLQAVCDISSLFTTFCIESGTADRNHTLNFDISLAGAVSETTF